MPTVRKTGSPTPGSRAATRGALLETCLEQLYQHNFHPYRSYAEFRRAEIVSPRYVIRNFPHASPYGTPGKKEGLIVAPEATPGFFERDEEGIRVVVEAKYQNSSGSVDEKIPFIWQGFLDSPILNWVVVFDGKYWKTGRGRAAMKWLENRPVPSGRRLHVVSRTEFQALVRDAWGRSS